MDVHMTRSRAIIIGLALTVLLDTLMQLLWKFSVIALPSAASPGAFVDAAIRQPWFLGLIAVGLVQLVNWLMVLQRAELSYAKPVASLSYVTVCLASARLFHEPIGALKALGIGCVLAGVWVLCKNARAGQRG